MPDIEKQLLGSFLVRLDGIGEVPDLMSEHFVDPAHRALFAVLAELYVSGKPFDLALLGDLGQYGGAVHIADLIGSGGIGSHAKYYAIEVIRRHYVQKLQARLLIATAKANVPKADPDQIIEELTAEGMSSGREDITTLADAASEAVARMELGERRGIPSGLEDLDSLTGGVLGLSLFAARPGGGKTALIMQIALYVAEHSGRVCFLSLEMSAEELAQRVLCAEAKVPGERVRDSRTTIGDQVAIRSAAVKVGRLPLDIHRPHPPTFDRIRRIVRAQKDAKLIVIDYFSLIDTPGRATRREELSDISRQLKLLSEERKVPIALLVQLNREAETGALQLSHLRDTGSLEQDADQVVFIERDVNDPTLATLKVKKNRHGRMGDVEMRWDGATTTFSPMWHDKIDPVFEAFNQEGFDEDSSTMQDMF